MIGAAAVERLPVALRRAEPRQGHVVVLYPVFLVLWGLSVDHPAAPLRDWAFLKWISGPTIVALALIMVVRRIRGRLNVFGLGPCFGLLLGWVAVSALLNGQSLGLTAAWIVFYLKFVALVVYLNNLPLRVATARRLLDAIVAFACLLTLEGYVRFALGLYEHPDHISLVLGPHGHLVVGMVCTLAVTYLTARALIERRASLLVLGAALASVSVPGEIKALMIAGPLVVAVVSVGYLWGMRVRFAWLKHAAATLLVLLSIVALARAYQRFLDPDLAAGLGNLLENVDTWLDEGGSLAEAHINRVSAVATVLGQISTRPQWLIAGCGPGSTFLSELQTIDIELGDQSWNQLAAMLAEIGTVGLALYVGLIVALALPGWRLARRLRECPADQRCLILTFFGVSIYFLLIAPLHDLVWRYDAVSYVFAVLAAAVYRVWCEIRPRAAIAMAGGGPS